MGGMARRRAGTEFRHTLGPCHPAAAPRPTRDAV